MGREDFVSDRVVHVTVRILFVSSLRMSNAAETARVRALTLKKFNLISCVRSIAFPDTGSVLSGPHRHSSRLAGDECGQGNASSLVLNFRTYGTMFSRSKTSARVGSSAGITATGFRKGCNDSAQQSLPISYYRQRKLIRRHTKCLPHEGRSATNAAGIADKGHGTHNGNRWTSLFPESTFFPVIDAEWLPDACSECVMYILSEL